MKESERLEKMLLLAYIYGELRSESDWIKKIPEMTDKVLMDTICDCGMCVDWE